MCANMIDRAGFHQMDATINVPTDPALLHKVFTKDTLRQIADKIGQAELLRLSQDTDHSSPSERKNLATVRQAIHDVTGHEAPWIMGFASQFGAGLRSALAEGKE